MTFVYVSVKEFERGGGGGGGGTERGKEGGERKDRYEERGRKEERGREREGGGRGGGRKRKEVRGVENLHHILLVWLCETRAAGVE